MKLIAANIFQLKWGFFLLLFIGLVGCGSTATPAEPASLLPERLAEAMPAAPQDPELMVKALQEVFQKWALEGNLVGNPDVLAGFTSLLRLANLDPVETMQTWLSEIETQADELEAADFSALEAALTADFQPLTLEASFFHLWQHAYESSDSADDAGVRLALIVALGDENLQREVIRAWRQLIEIE